MCEKCGSVVNNWTVLEAQISGAIKLLHLMGEAEMRNQLECFGSHITARADQSIARCSHLPSRTEPHVLIVFTSRPK